MKPMNPIEQRRLKSILIMGGTILTAILATAVISISILLEKRGSAPTAPNAPQSKPKADQIGTCSFQFTVVDASPSPSATPSPSPSASPRVSPSPSVAPSPTPPVSCNSTCTSNANCQSGLVCSGVAPGQTGFCRNPLCTGSTNCLCPTPSPTPPNGCNNGCVSNGDCASGMMCSSGLCRSTLCPDKANCLCGGSTPTPTTTTGTTRPSPTPTEQLPKAGSVLGTTTVFGLGAVITILGVIGFFAL